jgi:type IV pilus assembly protein PilC
MPTFTASYTTASGQNRNIRLQASDLGSARRSLRQRGIIPSSLQAFTGEPSKTKKAGSANSLFSADLSRLLEAKPGVKEKALFANKLAALVDAGVPIVRGLTLMAQQQKMPLFKRALQAITEEVSQGEGIGTAMRRWPKVFDKLTIAMIEAGETGGVLDETLKRLATLLEGNAKLQNQIKGAMGYPIAVLSLAVIIFLAMTIFLIPTFEGIFDSLGADLPPFTQAMVDLSELLRSPFSFFLVLAIVGGVVLFSRFYATPVGKRRVDAIILKLPLFGDLLRKTATAQFCRTFSSLSRAGVPILMALDIVRDTVGNSVLADAVEGSKLEVQDGGMLSHALIRRNVFPDMAMSMLAIGEETGQMDAMLSKVADFYEDEVEAAVKIMTAMLEPAMIVICGGIVASILVAMYLPMFSVFEKIR